MNVPQAVYKQKSPNVLPHTVVVGPEVLQDIQMKENKMKPYEMTCQICVERYEKIKDFKSHVRSGSHRKNVAALFHTTIHHGPVYLPVLVVLDYLRIPDQNERLVGLDMVTLCITPDKCGCFYLCHICEKNLNSLQIVTHLTSAGHCFKHWAHSNPELLKFAWFYNSPAYLKSSTMEENDSNGPGTLRILELPKMLLKRGKKLPYHQVMIAFSKTNKLTDLVTAHRPPRKTLQAYITDPARTYPLLGVNFLLEYSCSDSEWHCGYLCILCKKKLPAIDCISHCISFDHVSLYMQEAHPATLEYPKGSFTRYSYHFDEILSLANEAQKVHPPEQIQGVQVDLSSFQGIDVSSYANALDRLQLIRREKDQSEFGASVTPGSQLLYGPETLACSPSVSATATSTVQEAETLTCSLSVSTTATSAVQEAEKMHKDPAHQHKEKRQLLCVVCDQTLYSISGYKKHIKREDHIQKVFELFGSGLCSGIIDEIKLYHYLLTHRGLNSPAPLIGLNLLTVFVTRQNQCSSSPLYICHACEISISIDAATHLASKEHYFNTLAHTSPDLVFLGDQNCNQITEFAQKEAARQGNEKLQVCEIPRELWRHFKSLPYEKIMVSIEKHHPKFSKCYKVPMRVTLQSYAKSADRKSPLLGLQFMVKYSKKQPYPKCGYFCLLCERKLSEMHAIAHVLSFGHVSAYLALAHPGSLSKDVDNEQRSLILDLAQQAELIHPVGALQEVELDFGKFNELNANPFKLAVNALQLVFTQKGLGELKPSLVPGDRLVCSLEKTNSSQCVKQGSFELISLDAAHTDTSAAKTDLKSPNLVPKYTEIESTTDPTVSASTQMQPSSATSSFSVLSEASLHAQHPDLLKMNIETFNQAVLPHHKPTEAKEFCLESLQPPDTIIYQQRSKLAQTVEKQLIALQQLEQSSVHLNKGPEVPVSPAACDELSKYLKMGNREPVIGLNFVIECRSGGQPVFFMCVLCIKRVKENTVIKHLTSREHQIMYLKTNKNGPLLTNKKVKRKWLRDQAFILEKSEGFGETQILNLDPEKYQQIFCAPIMTALRKLRDCLLKLSSEISDQSAVAVSSSDDPRCDDERPELTPSIKEEKDHSNDQPRGTAMSEPAISDTILKQSSDDDPARSSPNLWAYLTSPARTEPVIGLSMVTEYQSFSGQNIFTCLCCQVTLLTSKYQCHLISPKHRFTYMKEKYPKLVEHWKNEINLNAKIKELHAKAQILQDSEGWGHLKVVEKEFKKLKEQSPRTAENLINAQEPEPSETSRATASTEKQGKRRNPKPVKQLKKKKVNKHRAFTGISNDVEEEIRSVKQEQATLLETSVFQDEIPNPLSGSHSCCVQSLDSCSISSVPVSPPPTVTNVPTTLPTPSDHSFQSPSTSSVPDLPLLSTQPVTFSQPLYEPISPPPPISHPSTNECQSAAHISLTYAPIPSSASSQTSSSYISALQLTKSHLVDVEDKANGTAFAGEAQSTPQTRESQFVCAQSIIREESRPLVSAVRQMFLFTAVEKSHAFWFLTVQNLFETKPIIGLSNIVECRTMSRPTFFLCLNCAEKISRKEFCYHMTSERHQYLTIRNQYPEIFHWQDGYKLIIHDWAKTLAQRERGLDAKVIKLDQTQYESLQSADFLSVMDILHRMYEGEESQNSLPSHVPCQNHRELPRETERETHMHHPQQSCDQNLSQTQEKPKKSQVLEREFYTMQGNLHGKTRFSSLSRDKHSLNTLKNSEKIDAQAQQTQHQSEPTGQTAESDSRNTGLHSSERHTEITKKTIDTDSTSSLALQTPELTAMGLQQITPTQNIPFTMGTKQEKPNYDSQVASFFGAPEETTGNRVKNTSDVMDYVNNRRAASEAVVGLCSVIVCRCEGQHPLYLCVCCSRILKHNLIFYHLLKTDHRYNYLKCRFPRLVEDWTEPDDRNQKSVTLMRLAHKVERTYEDEPGHLQEMKVHFADLEEIKGLMFDKAILKLQKIRKEQNLCPLQTSIFPKSITVLVKEENIETEVMTNHSPPLADLSETRAEGPRTTSKRRAVETDSSYQSPPLVKQMKLSSAVTSNAKLEHTKSRSGDHQMPSLPTPPSTKNSAQISTTNTISSKQTSNSHPYKSHISVSSTDSSGTRPVDKCLSSTQTSATLNKPSQKSSVKMAKIKPRHSSSDAHKTQVNASNPQLMAHSGLGSDIPALHEHCGSIICKTSLKRKHSESKTLSLSTNNQSGDPFSHQKQLPSVLKSPVSSKSSVMKRSDKTSDKDSNNFSQLQKPQKDQSILYNILSDKSQACHTNQTQKASLSHSLDKTVLKNVDVSSKTDDEQTSPKSPPQLSCSNISAISVSIMNTQGQEIARQHEGPLMKNRSSKNAWNYESRQFCSDALGANLRATPTSETAWKIPANDANISAYACGDNAAMSYTIPAHSANANLCFTKMSEYDSATSDTSPVIPPYAIPYQYLGHEQSASATFNSSAQNCSVAIEESSVHGESAASGSYLTDVNSAYTSQLVYQTQQVYQPFYSSQLPWYQTNYPFCGYKQAPQPNQATTFSGSVISAASANGQVPKK